MKNNDERLSGNRIGRLLIEISKIEAEIVVLKRQVQMALFLETIEKIPNTPYHPISDKHNEENINR